MTDDMRSAVLLYLALTVGLLAVVFAARTLKNRRKERIAYQAGDPETGAPPAAATASTSAPAKMPRFIFAPAILSVIGAMFVSFDYPPTHPMDLLKHGAPVFVVALLLTVLLMKRFGDRIPARLTRRGVGLAAFVVVFSGLGALYLWVNGAKDPNPPQERIALVRGKRTYQTKSSYRYVAVVQSWRSPDDTVELGIWRGEYEKVVPGTDSYRVTTGAGAFGLEWEIRHRYQPASAIKLSEDVLAKGGPEMEPLLVSAYAWTRVERTHYNPSESTASEDEKRFLAELFALTDRATLARIWKMQAIHGQIDRPPPEALGRGFAERLRALKAPARLEPVRALIADAVALQAQFMAEWKAKEDLNTNPRPAQASTKLREAYAKLNEALPGESADNKKSFYSHLCALDFF